MSTSFSLISSIGQFCHERPGAGFSFTIAFILDLFKAGMTREKRSFSPSQIDQNFAYSIEYVQNLVDLTDENISFSPIIPASKEICLYYL